MNFFKILWYKRCLKNVILDMRRVENDYDCGASTLLNISPSYMRLDYARTKLIDKLRAIDPNFPKAK